MNQDVSQSGDAARLLQDSARRVFHCETLRASIRMRVQMFDQHLVGKGNYYQLGPDTDKLMRLDLRMGTGPSFTSLRQLCNGRYLWIEKDFPSIENPGERDQAVFRVDLRTVRNHLQQQASSDQSRFPSDALVRGGLGCLLRQISVNFDFQAVRSGRHAGRPIWRLEGTWRDIAASRVAESTDQRGIGIAGVGGRATQSPRSVVVALGQSDGLPYRIDYFGHKLPIGEKNLTDRPIASLEILAAEFDKIIDPRLFSYKRNDFDDMTPEYLVRLGLIPGDTRR